LHTPVLRFWKIEQHFPYSNAAARELLGMTATSAPSERVFGVAATILCHPEPTKDGVEPKSLSIAAIAIQLNQAHSAIVIMTSM